MSGLYLVAGLNHFINPQFYRRIMPPALPAHDMLIWVSGVFELLLGMLLWPMKTRRMAAWGLIILLVAIFPANVQMMLDYRAGGNKLLWMAVLRLPLQLLLIYWAYQFTKHRGATDSTYMSTNSTTS